MLGSARFPSKTSDVEFTLGQLLQIAARFPELKADRQFRDLF